MSNIDNGTNEIRELSENELAAVSGGMDLIEAGGVGAWAAGGPAGYLIYQGGVGVGEAIKGWWHGRGSK